MSQWTWNKIIVGVDGSKESQRALAWACEQARPGILVIALSAWSVPPAPASPSFGGFPWGVTVDMGDATRTMLNDVVTEVQADFPDVAIAQSVVACNAAHELIKLSETADLVVGAKGHGGFTGMLTGSVSSMFSPTAPAPCCGPLT